MVGEVGEITLNWGELTMSFKQGEETMVIRGDPALEKRVVEPETLLKMSEVETWALVWSLESIKPRRDDTGAVGLTREQKEELEQVLEDHKEVFCELQGLPPDRDKKRQIVLKEGTDPVNVRPYCYPHLMKGEIE